MSLGANKAHKALGEAEAELACLQSCTLIDVVVMLYNDVLLFGATCIIRSGIPPSGKYKDMQLYSSDALQNCTSLKWGDLLLVTLMSSVDSESQLMGARASAAMHALLQLPGNVNSEWLQHGLWVLSHSDKSYKLSVPSLPLETPVDKDPLPAYKIEMPAVMLEYSRPDLVESMVNLACETGVIDLVGGADALHFEAGVIGLMDKD
ncbi:hypothetical protein M404DRAFT_28120 [Pisolithus tinctorius Marx 270]|uniref:XPG-I domain-containing protein n=1 Tax=Pisolithus tinctorius Marx 270 TaxID=870435 RepID=A0A0C3P4L5_PISTI|nr:hypothetical protein M404DRAFT_28120 [Pisolithus tinctorius Marx 270]